MVPRWVWINGPLGSSHGCLRLHTVSGYIKNIWCMTQSQYSWDWKKEELLLEIEPQWEMRGTKLLEEDNYFVEVSLGDMETTSGEHQHYWLLGIKNAWKAKLLQKTQEQQKTVGRETTWGTGQLIINFNISMRSEMFYHWLASDKHSSAMLLRIATYTVHEEENCPLLCGFTAMLFGSMLLAYEDSMTVKLV